MKRKILFLSAVILAFLVSATGLRQALAEVRFADDKIIVNGTIKQTMYYRTQMNSAEYKRYHKTRLDYNRFSALIEGQFKIKDCPEEQINFIGGFKYWYELAPVYDPTMHQPRSPLIAAKLVLPPPGPRPDFRGIYRLHPRPVEYPVRPADCGLGRDRHQADR